MSALGDSNTHGYCADPRDCRDAALLRFNEEERWTCLLQKALGEDYLVAEEGLTGRTTVFEDPLCPGLRALDYLYPCLKSHEPVALLILMLGTNDTKERFSANAFAIAKGMERLVRLAQASDCWGPDGAPNILLIAPPAIGQGVAAPPPWPRKWGPDAVEKSLRLPGQSGEARGGGRRPDVRCFRHRQTAPDVTPHPDFMHLTSQGHRNWPER